MKRRMRKVTALVLSVGMMLSMTITSGAVTIDEAQKKADELQSQKSAAQAEKDIMSFPKPAPSLWYSCPSH